jgi:hypothetical protein
MRTKKLSEEMLEKAMAEILEVNEGKLKEV